MWFAVHSYKLRLAVLTLAILTTALLELLLHLLLPPALHHGLGVRNAASESCLWHVRVQLFCGAARLSDLLLLLLFLLFLLLSLGELPLECPPLVLLVHTPARSGMGKCGVSLKQ